MPGPDIVLVGRSVNQRHGLLSSTKDLPIRFSSESLRKQSRIVRQIPPSSLIRGEQGDFQVPFGKKEQKRGPATVNLSYDADVGESAGPIFAEESLSKSRSGSGMPSYTGTGFGGDDPYSFARLDSAGSQRNIISMPRTGMESGVPSAVEGDIGEKPTGIAPIVGTIHQPSIRVEFKPKNFGVMGKQSSLQQPSRKREAASKAGVPARLKSSHVPPAARPRGPAMDPNAEQDSPEAKAIFDSFHPLEKRLVHLSSGFVGITGGSKSAARLQSAGELLPTQVSQARPATSHSGAHASGSRARGDDWMDAGARPSGPSAAGDGARPATVTGARRSSRDLNEQEGPVDGVAEAGEFDHLGTRGGGMAFDPGLVSDGGDDSDSDHSSTGSSLSDADAIGELYVPVQEEDNEWRGVPGSADWAALAQYAGDAESGALGVSEEDSAMQRRRQMFNPKRPATTVGFRGPAGGGVPDYYAAPEEGEDRVSGDVSPTALPDRPRTVASNPLGGRPPRAVAPRVEPRASPQVPSAELGILRGAKGGSAVEKPTHLFAGSLAGGSGARDADTSDEVAEGNPAKVWRGEVQVMQEEEEEAGKAAAGQAKERRGRGSAIRRSAVEAAVPRPEHLALAVSPAQRRPAGPPAGAGGGGARARARAIANLRQAERSRSDNVGGWVSKTFKALSDLSHEIVRMHVGDVPGEKDRNPVEPPMIKITSQAGASGGRNTVALLESLMPRQPRGADAGGAVADGSGSGAAAVMRGVEDMYFRGASVARPVTSNLMLRPKGHQHRGGGGSGRRELRSRGKSGRARPGRRRGVPPAAVRPASVAASYGHHAGGGADPLFQLSGRSAGAHGGAALKGDVFSFRQPEVLVTGASGSDKENKEHEMAPQAPKTVPAVRLVGPSEGVESEQQQQQHQQHQQEQSSYLQQMAEAPLDLEDGAAERRRAPSAPGYDASALIVPRTPTVISIGARSSAKRRGGSRHARHSHGRSAAGRRSGGTGRAATAEPGVRSGVARRNGGARSYWTPGASRAGAGALKKRTGSRRSKQLLRDGETISSASNALLEEGYMEGAREGEDGLWQAPSPDGTTGGAGGDGGRKPALSMAANIFSDKSRLDHDEAQMLLEREGLGGDGSPSASEGEMAREDGGGGYPRGKASVEDIIERRRRQAIAREAQYVSILPENLDEEERETFDFSAADENVAGDGDGLVSGDDADGRGAGRTSPSGRMAGHSHHIVASRVRRGGKLPSRFVRSRVDSKRLGGGIAGSPLDAGIRGGGMRRSPSGKHLSPPNQKGGRRALGNQESEFIGELRAVSFGTPFVKSYGTEAPPSSPRDKSGEEASSGRGAEREVWMPHMGAGPRPRVRRRERKNGGRKKGTDAVTSGWEQPADDADDSSPLAVKNVMPFVQDRSKGARKR